MCYNESMLSKSIYYYRELFKSLKKINKKIRKIWNQRNEYILLLSSEKKERVVMNNNLSNVVHEKIPFRETKLNRKVAVYTCIFGEYDTIREPLYKSKYCDYYIVTDQVLAENSIWNKIEPHNIPDGFELWHPAKKNRYYKMHPHELFDEYEYSIYIDGNIRPMTDLYPLVVEVEKRGRFMALHKHPIFSCLYDSAEHLKKIDLVDCELMDRQIKRYVLEGFPQRYGFFECSVILRKHHEIKVQQVMDTWWNEYCDGVKRDQQSFTYAIWKNGLQLQDICSLGNDVRLNSRFKITNHKKKHEKVL